MNKKDKNAIDWLIFIMAALIVIAVVSGCSADTKFICKCNHQPRLDGTNPTVPALGTAPYYYLGC